MFSTLASALLTQLQAATAAAASHQGEGAASAGGGSGPAALGGGSTPAKAGGRKRARGEGGAEAARKLQDVSAAGTSGGPSLVQSTLMFSLGGLLAAVRVSCQGRGAGGSTLGDSEP